MPTNEERREVASNLRKMVEEKNGIYNALDASPFANICSGLLIEYKVGANDYVHCCDVMLRIADLIEPEPETITCEFDSQACGKRRCKRCGAFVSVDSVWDCFGYIPVRYCPNCGARVIGNIYERER